MPDSIFFQICSAALYLATAAMLTYVSIGRPNLAKRLVAVCAIGTCATAIVFMMRSYAGEKEIVLERAGKIERRQIVRERGYFEFVDKPATATSSNARSAGSPDRGLQGAPQDEADPKHGRVRGFVTRLASAAGGLFGMEFDNKAAPCPECPEMVLIEPGYFVMGVPRDDRATSPYEGPQSVKRIGRRFAIARTETTIAQYMMFARATGRTAPRCLSADTATTTDPELPVTCVSWSDAVAHADWLSSRTGRTYRLPSEAEWEYAARAGSAQHDGIGASARLPLPIAKAGLAFVRTPQRVGTERPNAFGLHDAGGNVAELASDCWRDRPTALPGDGSPAIRRPCDRRAVRDTFSIEPRARGRLTARGPIGIGARSPGIGYRLAREL